MRTTMIEFVGEEVQRRQVSFSQHVFVGPQTKGHDEY